MSSDAHTHGTCFVDGDGNWWVYVSPGWSCDDNLPAFYAALDGRDGPASTWTTFDAFETIVEKYGLFAPPSRSSAEQLVAFLTASW